MATHERKPRFSVVVVTYNSAAFIERCLAPFRDADPADYQVIIVDNASKDDTVAIATRALPGALLIASQENLGFSGGNNLAFRRATGDNILLLNPDAFLDNLETLDVLAAELNAALDIAAVAPRLNNADGTHQTGDAGWRTSMLTTIGYTFLLQRVIPDFPSYYLVHPQLLNRPRVELDWVCGACMMVTRKSLEVVGDLDDRIFMYGEDVDWGTRARDAGLRVLYVPSVTVLHLQGATQREPDEVFFSTKSMESRATRLRRTYSPAKMQVFKMLLVLGYGLRATLFEGVALIKNRAVNRGKANAMWRYAQHASKL